jgi:pantothenate kinase
MTPRIPPGYLSRIEALLATGQRRLLGLVGPPGSGKSTLAQALVDALPGRTIVVPMDGFHLANAELARLGRAQRKGAPDTFDSAGYVALLRRLRTQSAGETVYAPEFRREIEEPIAGAIAVPADVALVITEGNYLLLDEGPWRAVREQLDEVWFVESDDAERREWLVQRHMRFGRSPQAARDWVMHTDEPNAQLISASRHRADLSFRWDGSTDISEAEAS